MRLVLDNNYFDVHQSPTSHELKAKNKKRFADKDTQSEKITMMDSQGNECVTEFCEPMAASTTVVEINPSSSSCDNGNECRIFKTNLNNNSAELKESTQLSGNHIIRRESIEKLQEIDYLQDNFSDEKPEDTTDFATLPVQKLNGKVLTGSKCDENRDDETKENANLVHPFSNTLNPGVQKPDDSSCLDCLAFTMECCNCTIM